MFRFSGYGTSASDNGRYPLLCYLASKDEKIFSTFKRNPIYRQMLEHVSKAQGMQYLEVISRYGLIDSRDWQEFSKNDLYGSPVRFRYDIGGMSIDLSPTTIRYTKVLCDILSRFDTSSIASIAEIGIGYGGQCRLIRTRLHEAQYTLFDLPEVLGLAERYLSRYEGCGENIRYVDSGHIYIKENYDLVISNYAFSELRREVQDIYLEKVIRRAKRGYIT